MSNLTVKQLRNMIREHKQSGSKCKPYSKLNKNELIKHAQDLGLIEGSMSKSTNKYEKTLDSISSSVSEMDLKSVSGKKKKESMIRRLKRIRNNFDKLSDVRKESAIKKLKKDLDKLRFLS